MINSNAYTVSNYRQSSKRTVAVPSPPVAPPTPRNPTRKPSRKSTRKPTKFKAQGNRNPTSNPRRKPTTTPTNPLPTCIIKPTSSSSCSQSQTPMIIKLDRPRDLSWTVMDQLTNQTYCNGGPYPSTTTSSSSSFSPLTYCLKPGKSLKIQLRDNNQSVGFLTSSSTYNVTIGTSGSNIYKYFTKNNGSTLKLWRNHSFTT